MWWRRSLAWFSALVTAGREDGARVLRGLFYPTAKNEPARAFYRLHDFVLVDEHEGVERWELDVRAGDICPAMVVATFGDSIANLQVMLDGADTYWATSVHYDADKLQRSWHWMFDG